MSKIQLKSQKKTKKKFKQTKRKAREKKKDFGSRPTARENDVIKYWQQQSVWVEREIIEETVAWDNKENETFTKYRNGRGNIKTLPAVLFNIFFLFLSF